MGLYGPGRRGLALAPGRCEDRCHTHVDGAGRNRGGWRRRREQVQAGAATLGYRGDAGGDPLLVKEVPRALPRAGLRLISKRVDGLGMLVAEPRSAPLANGPEDVLVGLGLVRLVWAFFLVRLLTARTSYRTLTALAMLQRGVVPTNYLPHSRCSVR